MDKDNLTIIANYLPGGAAFTLSESSPDGTVTYMFKWIPTLYQKGRRTVTFKATDGHATISKSIVITVT